MEKNKNLMYNIASPDGIPISFDWFDTPELAWNYYKEWKQRFERQGYYSSNRGRIPLYALEECVKLVDMEILPKSKDDEQINPF